MPPPETASPRSGRAAPLAPEDRRAAIVAATIPLLLARGTDVTTRELAECAGVAEGTLFRVFPDKGSLLAAAVAEAVDPAAAVADLEAIDPDLDLRGMLTRAVALLQARVQEVHLLLTMAHGSEHHSGGRPGHPHGPHGHGSHPVDVVVDALARLMTRHAAGLRMEPAVCARLLVAVVMTTGRPVGGTLLALTPEQVVDLFLDGAARGGAASSPTDRERPC